MRILFIAILLLAGQINAQDTFSIAAVDTLTGEVGSAGASCIDNTAIAGGAKIISDVIPGRGVIHTQSYWLAANQQNAHAHMMAGESPQQIIDWLIANDAQNLPGRRQYGIVDFDEAGKARSAAFTGDQCMNWKGHIAGINYSIQGNILLNEGIIDSMEARFLRAEGGLSDKLMAALQGANVPGADSRCLNEGVSSLSAFIRLARPTDHPDTLYLDLNVPQTPYGVEPIDSLQVLYDNWKMITSVPGQHQREDLRWKVYPNPAQGEFTVDLSGMKQEISCLEVINEQGMRLQHIEPQRETHNVRLTNLPSGAYYLIVRTTDGKQSSKAIVVP